MALVSDEDYEALSRYSWRFHKRGYPATTLPGRPRNKRTVMMHDLIMERRPGLEVDHINRDRLDNRRENLRLVTHAENMRNATPAHQWGHHGKNGDVRGKPQKRRKEAKVPGTDERGLYNPSIYLNEARRDGLDKIAESRRTLQEKIDATGKPYKIEVMPSRIDLIKEAVDEYLERHLPQLQAQSKG